MTVSDTLNTPPDATITSATVAITGAFAGAQDVLGLNAAGVALLTASPTATATAVLSGTTVGSIVVGYSGAEYAVAPTVTFMGGGGGSGATAQAFLGTTPATLGTVIAINVLTPGSGYTSAPTVVITPPTVQATLGTVTLDGLGSITIPVTNGGAGYVSAPVVKVQGGVFNTPATATATINSSGVVTSITVNGGTGYTSVPTVTIAPPAW